MILLGAECAIFTWVPPLFPASGCQPVGRPARCITQHRLLLPLNGASLVRPVVLSRAEVSYVLFKLVITCEGGPAHEASLMACLLRELAYPSALYWHGVSDVVEVPRSQGKPLLALIGDCAR